MNMPSTYSPREIGPPKNEADESLQKAKAVIDGQRKFLREKV